MSSQPNKRTLRIPDNEKGKKILNVLDSINVDVSVNDRLVEDIYLSECLREKYNKPIIEILLMFLNVTESDCKNVSIQEQTESNKINTESFLNQLEDIKAK